MPPTRSLIRTLLLCLFFALPALPQNQPATAQASKHLEAVNVLTRCVAAVGGSQAINSIKDFTAKGTITHFWAGEEIKGPATLRGRGVDQFRLDSDLPSGPRSLVIKNGAASLRSRGKEIGAPYQNSLDSGAMGYPLSITLAALSDPQISASAVEQVKMNDRDVLLIHTQRNVTGSDGRPDEFLSRRTAKEVLIDASTYIPIAVRSKVYPPRGFSGEFVQEIQFDDFRAVNGVLIPFVLIEMISGQKTWTFHADSVALNTGLSESDLDR
jgi:hypothetical protein